MQITEAVKHLLIINVLVFLATFTIFNEQYLNYALYYPETPKFKIWQVITHLFLHGNPSHLLFNMLSLFFIGPVLENRLGTRRFIIFYFVAGIGGALLHILYKFIVIHYIGGDISTAYIPALGASGAINGLFIALAYLYPNMEFMMMFIPVPIKAKYLAIFTIAADFLWGMSGYQTGIGHFAHLGGALFGFLLIVYWTKKGA